MDQVLETRLGYIKGLGYGPKSIKQSQSACVSKLTENLRKTQDKLEHSNFELLRDQVKIMREAMLEFRIHVPAIQFPGKSVF